ncbi:hypothetical protein RHSIM_Rhsim08G0039300 [Rhododendron simsii]|uniref:Coiled-coil domain-containing protein 86 n=1 Tax=Rhododendron simsii TaxID=118357 RepID=A0A834LGC9_RHOSS|nr:hypothetical protein RHSIM_Rhsim08G0039300 [Rhododendron simsii]
MDVDSNAPPSKRQAVPSSDNPNKPAYGNPTYNGVIAGRVSGRRWKQPRTRRSSAMHVKGATTSFEQRAKQKEVKRAYKERMVELKEEIRLNKVEKRKKREEREKRKKENVLRTGTKLQVITNPKTLKKIAKSKQRKQLKIEVQAKARIAKVIAICKDYGIYFTMDVLLSAASSSLWSVACLNFIVTTSVQVMVSL